MEKRRMISTSGGKDSTATLLLAREHHPHEEIVAVFADTGNEHEITLQYLDYLREKLGITIHTVRADFTHQLAAKRAFVEARWSAMGVPDSLVESALEMLSKPTGNPFLDLCIWKGRFPSRIAQFCTQNLKKIPLAKFTTELCMEFDVESWQGVRAEESESRAKLPQREQVPDGFWIYRPLLHWNVEQVFEIHRRHGIDPNPLYKMGMGRVGCMPCINARKDELAEIAKRFPEHVARIRKWEELVSLAAKRGMATFFNTRILGGDGVKNEDVTLAKFGIDAITEWAITERGGEWEDLKHASEPAACSSAYGLCE